MAAFDILTFSLISGVSDDDFIAIDARMQEWAYVNIEGIMRRTVAKNSDGEWIVIHLLDSVDQCGTHYFTQQHEVVTDWLSCVDHSRLSSRAYNLL